MKALFLLFHGFNEANGISKKIHYQVNALKECGVDVRMCYLTDKGGWKKRWVDNIVIADYGNGLKGKILKRIEFDSIVRYVIQESIQFVYMRSDHNANPFTIRMLQKLKKAGVKVVMEIPTYPYDQEYVRLSRKFYLWIDQCFRRCLASQLYSIVTFSNCQTIFGVSTIQICNGIDFGQISMKQSINDTTQELHLIGVAEIHYWHGFDRVVQGLKVYYESNPSYKVYFHIVGDFFGEREYEAIVPYIRKYHLEKYVILHGAQHGEELDKLFETTDMGVGSLGRHRSGITYIKTLKNREYAARGISFIYSETDSDFDEMPYILKEPADESPIDINRVIDFYRNQQLTPSEIRESIRHLSWKAQMQKVLDEVREWIK